MSTDFGIVTAYGYALSKGYQGTEEEFAELMARLPEFAGEAAESAGDAAAAAASVTAALPDGGEVSADGRLSFRHGATELFSVQLPLYGGETI